jgi:hypothetical protein
MPSASNARLERADAHYRLALRYEAIGDAHRAASHFGQACRFGAPPEATPTKAPNESPIPELEDAALRMSSDVREAVSKVNINGGQPVEDLSLSYYKALWFAFIFCSWFSKRVEQAIELNRDLFKMVAVYLFVRGKQEQELGKQEQGTNAFDGGVKAGLSGLRAAAKRAKSKKAKTAIGPAVSTMILAVIAAFLLPEHVYAHEAKTVVDAYSEMRDSRDLYQDAASSEVSDAADMMDRIEDPTQTLRARTAMKDLSIKDGVLFLAQLPLYRAVAQMVGSTTIDSFRTAASKLGFQPKSSIHDAMTTSRMTMIRNVLVRTEEMADMVASGDSTGARALLMSNLKSPMSGSMPLGAGEYTRSVGRGWDTIGIPSLSEDKKSAYAGYTRECGSFAAACDKVSDLAEFYDPDSHAPLLDMMIGGLTAQHEGTGSDAIREAIRRHVLLVDLDSSNPTGTAHHLLSAIISATVTASDDVVLELTKTLIMYTYTVIARAVESVNGDVLSGVLSYVEEKIIAINKRGMSLLQAFHVARLLTELEGLLGELQNTRPSAPSGPSDARRRIVKWTASRFWVDATLGARGLKDVYTKPEARAERMSLYESAMETLAQDDASGESIAVAVNFLDADAARKIADEARLTAMLEQIRTALSSATTVPNLEKLRRKFLLLHHPDKKSLHDKKAKELATKVSIEIGGMFDARAIELGMTWSQWADYTAKKASTWADGKATEASNAAYNWFH